jgi:hypothetical protein
MKQSRPTGGSVYLTRGPQQEEVRQLCPHLSFHANIIHQA